MPIPITCACGRSLRLKDELAGRKVRCPQCSTILAVPKPEAPITDEDEALKLLLEGSDDDAPTGIRQAYREETPPATDALQLPPPRRPIESVAQPEIKKKSVKTKSIQRKSKSSGVFFFDNVQFNGGVVATGLLMIVGAMVWFFGGLALGIVFFYPIVLFFLGLGTVFKGVTGRGD